VDENVENSRTLFYNRQEVKDLTRGESQRLNTIAEGFPVLVGTFIALDERSKSYVFMEYSASDNLNSHALSNHPSVSRYPTDWDSIAHQVRLRDGNRCVICGRNDRPLHVDHIHPRSQGGLDLPSNLRTLCEVCHVKRHPNMSTDPQWQKTVLMHTTDPLEKRRLKRNLLLETLKRPITKRLKYYYTKWFVKPKKHRRW